MVAHLHTRFRQFVRRGCLRREYVVRLKRHGTLRHQGLWVSAAQCHMPNMLASNYVEQRVACTHAALETCNIPSSVLREPLHWKECPVQPERASAALCYDAFPARQTAAWASMCCAAGSWLTSHASSPTGDACGTVALMQGIGDHRLPATQNYNRSIPAQYPGGYVQLAAYPRPLQLKAMCYHSPGWNLSAQSSPLACTHSWGAGAACSLLRGSPSMLSRVGGCVLVWPGKQKQPSDCSLQFANALTKLVRFR